MNALAKTIETNEAARAAKPVPRLYYVARIVPGREERFAEQCADRKIDVVVPMEARRVRCGARASRIYKRGLFGPYGFVYFENMDYGWALLKQTFDFRDLLRINDYYPMVTEAKVQAGVIAADIIAGRISTDNPAGYEIGNKVRIRAEKLVTWPDGSKGFQLNAFGGFIATIIRLPNSQRLRYLLETDVQLLGGKIKIEVGADEIEPY